MSHFRLFFVGIIIGAGAAGILVVNLPMLVPLLPIGSGLLFYLDIILMLWFVEMAFFTAKNGKPFEAAVSQTNPRAYPKASRLATS